MKHMPSSFYGAFIQHINGRRSSLVPVVILLSALVASPAKADEFADASKMVRSGQLVEALGKVDAFLSQHPRDAQMRFLKGLILTEQNKSSEAITIFTKLTEDYPDLPEPYNNLAVLYAASGQYDKARLALDMAIRTNPTYATAHENLGDVYAKLASQAYDKALQLDSSNSGAKSKLTLIRTLTSGNVNPKASAPHGSARTTAIASAPEAPATRQASPAAAPNNTQVAKAEPKPEPVRPAPKAEPASNLDHDEVMRVVHAWAKAWSAKDVKGYLGFYASDFATPKGESRKEWAEERRSRIEGKGRINVAISSPQVDIDRNKATVKFRQTYASDRLSANSRKTLVLEKINGKWLIKQERAGS